MNANEISENNNLKSVNSNARTLRIRKISRILKTMLLIYLFGLPLFLIAVMGRSGGQTWNIAGQTYSRFSEIPTGQKLVGAFATGIYLLIAVTFYRLSNLYEKRVFFSSENVRLFRMLGYLAFGNGLVGVVAPVISSGYLVFSSFFFSIVGSPWIVGGLVGIMISLIMDEGCKMREEQELTV